VVAMKQIAPHDRPREKMRQSGASALGDNELLALVLGEGVRQCNALDLATELLADHGGLPGLMRASHDRLCERKGVGAARAGRVIAALELGRRTMYPREERLQVTAPKDVAVALMPEFGARIEEHFGVLLLDTRYRVQRTRVLTVGTLDGTCVHPRDVFREAVTANAKAIVLFHNHPSGDPTPSSEDVALTQRLQAVGELMGIEVLDHVIVANERYYSFRESTRPPADPVAPRKRRM
jgi:DNA repair protein RadC